LPGKHLISVALLWIGLTAIGQLLVFADLFPTVGSYDAQYVDDTFRFLMILGMPVLTFVIAMVIYTVLRFRLRDRAPAEDGPPIRGTGWIPIIWLLVTGGLTLVTITHPGLTGLARLQAEATGRGFGPEVADVEIEVTAFMFQWIFTYPDGTEVSIAHGGEVVLPVNKLVRFNVNSVDVVHSLWIPVFRMKIDAIPGRTTFLTVKPTKLGSYETDQGYRVVCAELCGLDHTTMWMPLRVVTQEEYEAWLAGLRGEEN
jgi:cytochrome c oxidase subunit 2